MLVSIFFLIGGLYFENTGIPPRIVTGCLIAGIVLLAVGVIFYRICRRLQKSSEPWVMKKSD
jgi:amino acid transporter